MKPKSLGPVVAILVAVMLLQSYFFRELVVFELFFTLLLFLALAAIGTTYLIGSAVIWWFERPRRGRPKPHIAWNEGRIES